MSLTLTSPNVALRHKEVLETLALFGHGELLDALADDLRALEKAVSETGKAGTVTLVLKSAPNGHKKRILTYDCKLKAPKVPTNGTYCFATDQGQYVENNPDQMDLPLNTVEFTEAKPRAVGE